MTTETTTSPDINLTVSNPIIEPVKNPARNTMQFEANDLNNYKCRICFNVDCHNFENLQAHFELKHPVEQRANNFYQNNQLVATYDDNVCILKNCTYSKKLFKMTKIQKLRYRMVLGGDYSGFKGFLPYEDEFQQDKGLMICVANTENVKNYSEDIVSNFIKTYRIMATLTPLQFTVPKTGSMLHKNKLPFSSRNRQPLQQNETVIQKLGELEEVIIQVYGATEKLNKHLSDQNHMKKKLKKILLFKITKNNLKQLKMKKV